MLAGTALLTASLLVGAAPATRIAVVLEDPAANTPAAATLERVLQSRGFEVVASDASQKMRQVVAPRELLGSRLPEGLSVFEADAILAGAVSYGEPSEIEGVKSVSVSLTVRLIDLGTGQAAATLQSEGVGVGAGGPAVLTRAVEQAVAQLFDKKGLTVALSQVGQASGSVTLIVQEVPNRGALLELRERIQKSLAGAPVKEIYFANRLGKLVLGGAKSDKAMVGPEIADILAADKELALSVDEVANTRIVARYDRQRTVNVRALVLEPRTPKRERAKAEQLGRYLATELANLKFVQAAYQVGSYNRKSALKLANDGDFTLLVETELTVINGSRALAVRMIDVKSGRPIFREQKVLPEGNDLPAVLEILATVERDLPEAVAELTQKQSAGKPVDSSPTAKAER